MPEGPTATLLEYTGWVERAMALEESIEELGGIPEEDEWPDYEEVDDMRAKLREMLKEFNEKGMMYMTIDMGQLEVQKVLRLFETAGDSAGWMQQPSETEFNQPFFTYALEKDPPRESLAAIVEWCYPHPTTLHDILVNLLKFYCSDDGVSLLGIICDLGTSDSLVFEARHINGHEIMIAFMGLNIEGDPLGDLSRRISVDVVKELLMPPVFSRETILDDIIHHGTTRDPRYSQCMGLRAMKSIAAFLKKNQPHVTMRHILFDDEHYIAPGKRVCSFLADLISETHLDQLQCVCSVLDDLLGLCDQESRELLFTHRNNGKQPLHIACEIADKIEFSHMMSPVNRSDISPTATTTTETRINYGLELLSVLIRHMPHKLIDIIASGDSSHCRAHAMLVAEMMTSDQLIAHPHVRECARVLLEEYEEKLHSNEDTRSTATAVKSLCDLKLPDELPYLTELLQCSTTPGNIMAEFIGSCSPCVEHIDAILDACDDLTCERALFDAVGRPSAMGMVAPRRPYNKRYFDVFMRHVPRHAWKRMVTWDSSHGDPWFLTYLMMDSRSLIKLFRKLEGTTELANMLDEVLTPYTDIPGRTLITKYREGHFIMALVCDHPIVALDLFKSGVVDSRLVRKRYPVGDMTPLDLAIYMDRASRAQGFYGALVDFLRDSATVTKGAME